MHLMTRSLPLQVEVLRPWRSSDIQWTPDQSALQFYNAAKAVELNRITAKGWARLVTLMQT